MKKMMDFDQMQKEYSNTKLLNLLNKKMPFRCNPNARFFLATKDDKGNIKLLIENKGQLQFTEPINQFILKNEQYTAD